MNGENYYTGGNKKDNGGWRALKIIITVAVALIIVAVSFVAGFFTDRLTRKDAVSSFEWALKTIDKNYYGEFSESDAADLSLSALAKLLDPYSEYYTASEYEAILKDNGGEKSGVGISYNFIEGEGAKIVTVVGNSPAYIAGLTGGETIIGGTFGETSVSFEKQTDMEKFFESVGTGNKFTLNTSKKSYTVSREFYNASYTFMATADTAWEFLSSGEGDGLALYENPEKALSYLPDGSAYVRFSQFFGGAADEFGSLMEKFNASGCTSLILDLRNNGGGYVDVMQDLSGYFTSSVTDKKCTAMTAEYKNGSKEVSYCYRHKGESLVKKDTEVYVLANSGTASASEALIGVLISYDLLKYENIFISDYSREYLDWAQGQEKTARTYGKGIMQSSFRNYATGEVLKLTTAKIYWPNGKCIHDIGLTAADGCTLVKTDWTMTEGDQELRQIAGIIKSRI